MKTFKKIYNIYSYLSILLHELSHLVMIYLVGAKVERVTFEKRENLGFGVLIETDRKVSKFKSFLLAYSPYLVIVLFGVLALFSNIFLVLFVYTLTNLFEGVALPSKEDKEFFRSFDTVEDEECFDFDLEEELSII